MFAISTCRLVSSYTQRTSKLAYRKNFLKLCQDKSCANLLSPSLMTRWHRRWYQDDRRTAAPTVYVYFKATWNKLFGKYLLATNTISSGLLMVIGDIAAQEVEYQRRKCKKKLDGNCPERYDLGRIGRMFIVGALQGPLHHYVYRWMDNWMPLQTPRTAMWKILIDQIVMSPLCILIFFYSACFLEEKNIKETNDEMIDKFGYIYLMDWMVWPAAQYVNFRYLESRYRVMFVNVCTAVYNVFLSFMKHDFDTNNGEND